MSATIPKRSFVEWKIDCLKNDKNVIDELKKEKENASLTCLGLTKCSPEFMNELFPVVSRIIEKIENENAHSNNGILIFLPGLAELQELQD